jgi:hypothetical protein
MISKDMQTQYNLLKVLKPYQASLKFKLPYYSDDLVEYLDGDVMLQCYSPATSHECRLFTRTGSNILNKKLYNVSEFSKKCFNFQTTLRTSIYTSPIQDEDMALYPSLAKYGVASDHCYDCTLCKKIINDFLKDESKVYETLENIVFDLAQIHIRCKA